MTQYTDLWEEEKIETLNSELDERNREIVELQKALETANSKLEMYGQVPKTQNLISNSNEHTDPTQLTNSIKTKTDNSPTPVNSMTPETRLIIQVGDKHFTTTRETLTSKSTFFSTFFSSGHDVEKTKKQSDSSYFIDADGNLFTHILAYLRRGTLPLFFNTSTGHDHALYNSLLTEAKYFEIPQLIQYLSTQQYLKAVRVVASIVEEEEENGRGLVEVQGRDGIEMMDVFPTWQKKMVYVCPRAIEVHRGNPSACGRQCRNAQVGEERRFDEDLVLRVAVVKKRVVVDGEALRG